MTKIAFLFTLFATILVCLLPAAPARAQAIRTFVSVAGSDANPCTITAPCRHFQAAVTATAAGGEVDALDPGAYGSFTIGQAITIEGQGWSYVAPPANGNAITIAAGATDKINIRGVSLNGVGVTNAFGINFNSGGSLSVENSVVRNFSDNGIEFVPNTSGPSQLFVSNTLLSDNGANGILIAPSGSGTTTGVLDHVALENNGSHGLNAATSAQIIAVTVTDSVSANNVNGGITAIATGGTVGVMVRNSTIANNGSNGLQAANAGATIRVTRSTITGNVTGWAVVSSGVVSSYVDNNIDGNGGANTPPPVLGYR